MKPYELTYIISSSLTGEEADKVKKDIEAFVQEKGGVILKSEKTVPQSLAYSIKKHSSGYFITLEFQLEEKEVKQLNANITKEPKILRHFLIVKKPIKIMKERRTKKPFISEEKAGGTPSAKPKEKPANLEDIDKKLDEILSA